MTLAGSPSVWGNSEIDPSFCAVRLDQVSGTGGSVLARLSAATRSAKHLRQIVKERRIDIIHSHETAPAIVAKIGLLSMRVPKLITYHGSAPERTKQFAKVSKSCADHVISPSQTTLDHLIDNGVPKVRTKLLGLGIAQKPKPDPRKVEKLKAELELGPDDHLVFSLSRLDFQKGIDIMIEVATKALTKNPNVVFAVAGTGPLADEVEGWAANAGISERFRFLGSVSDVENYLALADVFLLTSRWEALPISIVEAFRAGLPVIATDCGGVKELVDSDVGRLCAVEDVNGLANAVSELLTDDELRERLANNALLRSKRPRFDPNTVHSEFETFYRQVVNGK